MPPPLTELQIELAGVCNIACAYCTWRQREVGKQLMDTELAVTLLEQAAQFDPVPLVTLHGVGEATLHPHFRALLTLGHGLGLPLRLSTNCLTLDTARIAWLRQLTNLNFILALHQGVPIKTKKKAQDQALDFLASGPRCRQVEVLLVCDDQGASQAGRLAGTFLPVLERVPHSRLHFKQPQTWPKSPPVRGHIPTGAWEQHPQVLIDRVATPRSLARGCSMPDYLLSVQADGTTTLCCVGEEDWGLANAKRQTLADIWQSAAAHSCRDAWRASSDRLPCGHCKNRGDC